MGQVNSRGESRPLERVFGSVATRQGAQLSAEKAGIPALQRADPRTERLSALGVLADGEDSNSRCLIGPKLQGDGSFHRQAYGAKSLMLFVLTGPFRYARGVRKPREPSSEGMERVRRQFLSVSKPSYELLPCAPAKSALVVSQLCYSLLRGEGRNGRRLALAR